MQAPVALPESLLRNLFLVDANLLVSRYWDALDALGVSAPRRSSFHIDAAGFSPEIAADLDDAHYLRSGVLHAHAVIISVAQLRAPLVHPSLGYAAEAYREVTRNARSQIEGITLREPLLGEVRQASTHFKTTQQLADLSTFELHFRTPGGLVRSSQKLEEMKAEFLKSTQRWLDDEFIAEMADLAREVRDLGALPDRFVSSRHNLGLFFSPAFGGSYVLEEEGASAKSATTYILSVEPDTGEGTQLGDDHRSARGRRVVVETLEPASAVAALERHGIARFDPRSLIRADVLSQLQHWIAVDHLLSRDPERPLASYTAGDVTALMRAESDPPPEYLEVEDVARRLAERSGRVDPETLSPITRLRLLTPSTSRADVRSFVGHLQAFVDPLHLARWWSDAPDVFFGRLHRLSPAHRDYFAGWVDDQAEPTQ